ncbi:hypothetical protein ACJJTC_007811 [Scirpophaga incertulas]
MSYFKTMFCDFFVILVLRLIVVSANESSSTTLAADELQKGNCSCGGFPTTTPIPDQLPVLAQAPGLVVKCNDEGQGTCKSLCHALAIATKAKGPEILCHKLKVANELKLSAFYKTCDMPWMYADLTAEEPLCCENAKVTICSSISQLRSNSSDVVDTKSVM